MCTSRLCRTFDFVAALIAHFLFELSSGYAFPIGTTPGWTEQVNRVEFQEPKKYRNSLGNAVYPLENHDAAFLRFSSGLSTQVLMVLVEDFLALAVFILGYPVMLHCAKGARRGHAPRCFRLFPILFVIATTGYLCAVYTACYVVPALGFLLDHVAYSVCDPGVASTPETQKRAKVTGFVVLTSTVLFVYSYTLAMFTDPGLVPATSQWSLRHNKNATGLSQFLQDRKKSTGERRYCKHCKHWKPDRAHHCRFLGKCVLKMDHYCPWLDNTIGLQNYKYFLLAVLYASVGLLSVFYSLQTEVFRIVTASSGEVHLLPLFLLQLAAGIGFFLGMFSLAGFFFHLYLIRLDCTTCEFTEEKREKQKIYWWTSYRDVCGGGLLSSLLPCVNPNGNGSKIYEVAQYDVSGAA
ncbi:unnamed protein product [Amoebophrya sp. A120]|nr:unnamed protein product [Amoebophrya sp. A120]|eukprot:GSA120T00011467001.1